MAIQSDVQYAVIDHAASGDNTLVAAVAGKRIRVLAFLLVAAGTVTARVRVRGADGTALTGQMSDGDRPPVAAPYSPAGGSRRSPGSCSTSSCPAAFQSTGC